LPDSEWGSRIISLDSQKLITNKTNIDQLDAWLLFVHEINYLKYGSIVNEGSLILRYRIISLSKHIYHKINDKDLIIRSNVPLKKYNPIGIDKIHVTNELYPNSIHLNDYGILITSYYKYNNKIGSLYQYRSQIQILVIDNKKEGSSTIIHRECYVFKHKNMVLSYIDIINSHLDFYTRMIGYNYLYYSKDGILLNKETIINCKFLTKNKMDLIHDTKIITFDIECYLNNQNKNIAYACGYTDGKHTSLYYLTEYKNTHDMLYTCFYDMITKYNNYTIYVHNFSNFDYYLILDMLRTSPGFKMDPFYKDNKLYSLTLRSKINNKVYSIIIKDSYLLLDSSLRQLGQDYNVDVVKGYFPYTFVKNNNLEYIGEIPDYYYYKFNVNKPITYDLYLEMKKDYLNNNWSLKNETLKYLESDLLCLYQVISQFSKHIFQLEHLNITKSLSISSLTFKVFKTNYLKDPFLPIIKGMHHDLMREAFFGGHVDVYTPTLRTSEACIQPFYKNIYCYDVNSLYPYVMSIHDFPMGKPLLSFDKDLNNYFGIVHCKIETPEYMDKPVLPFRGNDGIIYFPLGNWTGTYFSEELKEAVNLYGYKVEIISGYKFERTSHIFTDLVNRYFELKKYAKSIGEHSQAAVAKLIMNSLFGRIGMKPIKNKVKIVNKEESDQIHLYHDVVDNISLNNNLEYIKYNIEINSLFYELNGLDKYEELINKLDINKNEFETSLPIAIAITAYARMYMNQFIQKYNCYNTDTDSLFIDVPLSEELVGDKLGQFKLEMVASEAYFISPKLYYLENENENKIVIKARTLGGESLSKQDFIEMSYGLILKKTRPTFISSIKDLSVSLNNITIELNPIITKRYPIYSLLDGQLINTRPLKVINGILEKVNIKINTQIIPADNYNKI
jgi:DNA polymerase type B, organellar and viral